MEKVIRVAKTVKRYHERILWILTSVMVLLFTTELGLGTLLYLGVHPWVIGGVMIIVAGIFAVLVFIKYQYDTYTAVGQRVIDVHEKIEIAHSGYKWFRQGYFKKKVK